MFKFSASVCIMLCLLWISPDSHSALLEKNQTVYFPADKLPKESLVPGGIVLIYFDFGGKEQPRVTFQDQQVMVLNIAKNLWVAVVGLSLSLSPETYSIEIFHKKRSQLVHFKVQEKNYEAQHITLKEQKYVNPNPTFLDRISAEAELIKNIFSTWREHSPPALTMSLPTEGPLSSQFGLKRFFNKEARSPHSGLDIAAVRGSAVQNPLTGIVAAVGSYYLNGNTVLIDHGQGLVTMYCHLEKIQVIEGQALTAGELIGSVGSSGRATGPHLHWSVSLNNARVEPLLFLQENSSASEVSTLEDSTPEESALKEDFATTKETSASTETIKQ